MSLKYDALQPPDPQQWLTYSEDERIEAVEAYHRTRRLKVPRLHLHATFHVVVENQIALGDETPVQQTLLRLMDEGLDRHDAIHAIGSVLAAHMFDLLKTPELKADPNAAYYRELNQLTSVSWRASGST